MEHTISAVGVLDKSISVLDAVAAADGPCRLGDLVAATGLSKPTAHRLATALAVHGLLRRDPDGRYLLGFRLVGLGHAAADDWPLGAIARPILEELRDETGESVQLYLRDGDQRTCVASLESPQELRTIVAEGVRLPLGLSSAGRILDGSSVDAGWVASVEERARGVASVSAAVVRGGEVIAAVGISGPLHRLGSSPGERFGPAVERAAQRIASASAMVTVEARTSSVSPDLACIFCTTSGMDANASSSAWITRSTPSPRMFRSPSVTSAEISMSLSLPRSRPVISQSTHTILSVVTSHSLGAGRLTGPQHLPAGAYAS